MSENSKIEWCHHTFNPWIGCTKVGPGCDNCYAEADFDKRLHIVQWGAGQPRKRTVASNWAHPLRWNAEAERLGVRYRVFCASLADVFDNEVPAEWRADLFDLIERTPHLDWLLVTKRIGNVRQMIPDRWSVCMPPNLWLGITVVNQAESDRDIPKLLGLKVSVRFLSMEPLLGPVDLRFHVFSEPTGNFRTHAGKRQMELRKPVDGGLHWVVVGGESGPKARPMHPKWARDIRDQCAAASVPFLFKQWGEWSPRAKICGAREDFQTIDPQCKRWPDVIRLGEHGRDTRIVENCTDEAKEEVYVQRVGKKHAGRLLDGAQHDGYPEVRHG